MVAVWVAAYAGPSVPIPALYTGGGLLLATPPLAFTGSLVRRHRYRRDGLRVDDWPLAVAGVSWVGFELLAVGAVTHVVEDASQWAVMLGGLGAAGFTWHAVATNQARDRVTGE